MGSLYWQLETPLISHWVSCSSFWVHLFWNKALNCTIINHENEQQKKLCFFAFKRTQCVYFSQQRELLPCEWISSLTHIQTKKCFFWFNFCKIYLYSIKFLPKFGNQKLTLDLVINTYTPWSQWKKNIQPFLCCQVQKNCDTLWYGTHHTHNTRLHNISTHCKQTAD